MGCDDLSVRSVASVFIYIDTTVLLKGVYLWGATSRHTPQIHTRTTVLVEGGLFVGCDDLSVRSVASIVYIHAQLFY